LSLLCIILDNTSPALQKISNNTEKIATCFTIIVKDYQKNTTKRYDFECMDGVYTKHQWIKNIKTLMITAKYVHRSIMCPIFNITLFFVD
jgi:hypothetical protein